MASRAAHVPNTVQPWPKVEPPSFELITAEELAKRWNLPVSWIRDRTRSRTPREERIPCVRCGRYVRFRWPSRELDEWLERHRG
jgi:hypothetical protein